MQFKGSLVNQNWEMAKNLILGLILACFRQDLILNIFVNFTRCYNLLQAIIVCNFKEN